MKQSVIAAILALLTASIGYCEPSFICIYKDLTGIPRQVSSLMDIPDKFKPSAKCGRLAESEDMDRPQDVELEGRTRTETISTRLGPMQARWPRSIAREFKRNPSTAIKDAARAVANAVGKNGFPFWVQKRVKELDWQIVFIDDTDRVRIPDLVKNSCHPGWMTPPANIYIATSRITNGCGSFSRSRRVSQSELATILIHEMGHVIEFQIVDPRIPQDPARAEGFASWFETIASDKSSFVKRGTAKKRVKGLAERHLEEVDHNDAFNNEDGQYLSGSQYARAASYFTGIENRHGIRGIFDVYERMGQENLSFIDAVHAEFGWDEERLREEALKSLR